MMKESVYCCDSSDKSEMRDMYLLDRLAYYSDSLKYYSSLELVPEYNDIWQTNEHDADTDEYEFAIKSFIHVSDDERVALWRDSYLDTILSKYTKQSVLSFDNDFAELIKSNCLPEELYRNTHGTELVIDAIRPHFLSIQKRIDSILMDISSLVGKLEDYRKYAYYNEYFSVSFHFFKKFGVLFNRFVFFSHLKDTLAIVAFKSSNFCWARDIIGCNQDSNSMKESAESSTSDSSISYLYIDDTYTTLDYRGQILCILKGFFQCNHLKKLSYLSGAGNISWIVRRLCQISLHFKQEQKQDIAQDVRNDLPKAILFDEPEQKVIFVFIPFRCSI